MSATIIAASAGDTIVKLGAYAGFASIIGLAVMALLYFAQAREVKRLREWAGRAPERDAEFAQRVQADVQRRVVAQPMAPATMAAQQAEANRAAAAAALQPKAPSPPAPLVGPPGQLARPVAPGAVPGTLPATAAAPGTAPGATPAPATAVPGVTTPMPTPVGVPGAVTPAAAAAAASFASAVANGAGQETHESDAARPEPIGPQVSADSFSHVDDSGFAPGRTGAIIGGAVAAVLVAIVLMVVLTQGNDSPTKPNDFGVVTTPKASAPAAGGTSTSATATPPAVDRRATRVAVLNGTQQTGLARTVADEVEKARFTISGTENNADQRVATTTVSYTAGNQRAAAIVAQVIGIDRASVQPVDANSSVAADADIVVIVGADKIG